MNVGADLPQAVTHGEWKLHPEVVSQIWERFYEAEVELFASQETAQCPLCQRRIGIPTKRPWILPLPVSHGGFLCCYFLAQVRAPIGRSVTVAMALPTQ